MLHTGNNLIDQLLIPFFLWIFVLAGIAGIALGLGLILRSTQTLRFLRNMNRWVSLRSSLKPMETPRDIGKTVYGQRRTIGSIFAISGAYIIYMLGFKIKFASVIVALSDDMSPVISHLLIESLRWFLVTGGALAILVGVMLIVSTDAMRALEDRVNQWHSTRQLGKGSDTMHLTLDHWAETFPRVTGLIISLGSAMVLIAWFIVWLGR